MLDCILLHVGVHVEGVGSILLRRATKHIFRNQIVLVVVVSLSHHVLLVGGGGAEGVVVLLMPLVHPAHLEPVLIRFSLVVVALVEFGTIHLRLLVGQVGLVIHTTLLKTTTLRIYKPLLPLVLIFVYAYINPSSILLRALTWMLLVR